MPRGGLDNLAFEVDALPTLDVDRRFECVPCIATLHYIREIGVAIRDLFDRVRPGGTLVFNYPNRGTRRWYNENAEGSDRERFRPVIDGENLLTYDRIESILDTRPRSFWRAVGEDEWRSLGRTNPCVYVQKPTD